MMLDRVTATTGTVDRMASVLLDVWRQRWVGLLAAASVFLLGLGYVTMRPERYEVASVIELGSRLVDSKAVYLEAPETVATKLNEALIPLARTQLRTTDNAAAVSTPTVTASVPRNSNVVILKSVVKDDESGSAIKLHSAIGALLVADHERTMSVVRSSIQRDQRTLEAELRSLENGTLLQAKIAAIDVDLTRTKSAVSNVREVNTNRLRESAQDYALLKARAKVDELRSRRQRAAELITYLEAHANNLAARAADLRLHIERSRQERGRATAKGPTEAMTMMLIDSEIQQRSSELGDLEEQLTLKNPHAILEARAEVAQLEREEGLQEKSIDQLVIANAKENANTVRELELGLASVSQHNANIAEASASNEAAIAAHKARLADLNNHFSVLRDTVMLMQPQKLGQAVGPGAVTMLGIVGILSVLFGAAAAWVACIVVRIRHTIRHQAVTTQPARDVANQVS